MSAIKRVKKKWQELEEFLRKLLIIAINILVIIVAAPIMVSLYFDR